MKIEIKKLTDFLEKITLSGEDEITEGTLYFEDTGVKFSANNGAKTIRACGWLKKEAFTEYEAIGGVSSNQLNTIIKVLDRFSGEVTIKKEGNLLSINSKGKSVQIELASEGFITSDMKEPPLTFTESFQVNSSVLDNIVKDVNVNKDATIMIRTTEKKVEFSNTGAYKFRTEVDAITVNGTAPVSVVFGNQLFNAIANLKGLLEVSVASDYPIKITEITPDSIVYVIVAPRVDTNE
jgi:hypothetical protein